MAETLTRLTHKIAIQLHLVAESCTIFSSQFRRPVRKLLDTPSYATFRLLSVQPEKTEGNTAKFRNVVYINFRLDNGQ